MYIKKAMGPSVVTLSDGSKMTRADLPPPGTRRWVTRRKAAVIKGILSGLIGREEACEMYEISEDELNEWMEKARERGEKGLRATSVRKDRQP
ncbi:MAG: DUF1153 domain-containing protein [Paracoccaceae bacterium]